MKLRQIAFEQRGDTVVGSLLIDGIPSNFEVTDPAQPTTLSFHPYTKQLHCTYPLARVRLARIVRQRLAKVR